MTRHNANRNLTVSHYTRATGAGEAISRGFGPARERPDAPPQLNHMETIMFRTRTAIATLALTISTLAFSAAQAGTDGALAAHIHDAAVTACAPERATGTLPRAHYGAIDDACVFRVSRSAMAKYEALAKAGTAVKVAGN